MRHSVPPLPVCHIAGGTTHFPTYTSALLLRKVLQLLVGLHHLFATGGKAQGALSGTSAELAPFSCSRPPEELAVTPTVSFTQRTRDPRFYEQYRHNGLQNTT